MAAPSTNGIADDPRARVAAVVARHERTLLRVARQCSLCHDDALDAYQRALEIFVRRVETVDPATEVAWLKVVVRHEAMAIRRARSESVTGEELDLDAFVPGPERGVDEVIASSERVHRSAEALRALKPDEAKALMMKAHGLSYEEIGHRNGWTYTKVNRAITEGRRRFMRVYEEIESGEECARLEPIVEALATGAATSAQVVEIRPHLRHCATCRAAVRDLHLSRLRRASLFWPLFALFGQRAAPPPPEDLVREVAPRPVNEVDAAEIALDAERAGWLTNLKDELLAFLHRVGAPDVATGIHIAASGGGAGSGRWAAALAILAACLSSATVGTICVVTGVLPNPIVEERPDRAKPRSRAEQPPKPRPPAGPTFASAVPTATPTATATRTAAVRRRAPARKQRRSRPPSPAQDPAQGRTPTSHRNAPITPALTTSTGQDSFTPEAPQGRIEPAHAPATGGGEFAP